MVDFAVMADDAPANRSSLGTLCVKGRFGPGSSRRDRITTPPGEGRRPLARGSWDEALDLAADGLARPSSPVRCRWPAPRRPRGRLRHAEVVRAVMGTNNVDHCTRLCHSPSVEAMLGLDGSGATSNSYVDTRRPAASWSWAPDASANHPVIAIRSGARCTPVRAIVVINPKRIELVNQADLWIAQRPGTDVTTLNAMAKVIPRRGPGQSGLRPRAHRRVETWRQSARAVHARSRPGRVTGVPKRDIAQAARWYARPPFAGSCLV